MGIPAISSGRTAMGMPVMAESDENEPRYIYGPPAGESNPHSIAIVEHESSQGADEGGDIEHGSLQADVQASIGGRESMEDKGPDTEETTPSIIIAEAPASRVTATLIPVHPPPAPPPEQRFLTAEQEMLSLLRG